MLSNLDNRIVTKGVWEGDLCKLCTEVSHVECNQKTANEANCEQQNSPTTSIEDKKVDAMIWHHRFGHVGMHALELMEKKQLVHDMKLQNPTKRSLCEGCLFRKPHRKPFSQRRN